MSYRLFLMLFAGFIIFSCTPAYLSSPYMDETLKIDTSSFELTIYDTLRYDAFSPEIYKDVKAWMEDNGFREIVQPRSGYPLKIGGENQTDLLISKKNIPVKMNYFLWFTFDDDQLILQFRRIYFQNYADEPEGSWVTTAEEAISDTRLAESRGRKYKLKAEYKVKSLKALEEVKAKLREDLNFR